MATSSDLATTVQPVRIRLREGVPPRPRSQGWAAYVRLIPVVVLMLGVLAPPEVRINIVGQNIYAYRIAYFLFLPWVFFALLKGQLRYKLNDLLIVMAGAWIVLAMVVVYGAARGIPSGVAVALDLIFPFLIARLSIRDMQDFRRLLILLAPIVFLVAITLPIEAITNNRFIRDTSIAIFGRNADIPFEIKNDTRLGMLRAMGPFSHPIMAGLFFCILLPLYYFAKIRGWPMVIGMLSGFVSLFTFSSAAMIGVIVFVVVAIYDYLCKIVQFLTWPLFNVALIALLFCLQVLSQNGLLAVLIRFTFNPQSGYYRLLIWEYGSASVQRHPWFGIGLEGFERLAWMHESVDAFWLAMAMRSGLPASLLLVLATMLAIIGLGSRISRTVGANKATAIGLTVAMALFFILGFTVSFFGGLFIWFAIVLGIATTFASIGNPRRQRRPLIQRRVSES